MVWLWSLCCTAVLKWQFVSGLWGSMAGQKWHCSTLSCGKVKHTHQQQAGPQHRAQWSMCQVSLSEVKGSHPNLCFHSLRKHTFVIRTIKKHEITQRLLEHVLDPNCLKLLLMATWQYTWPEQSKGCVSNLNFVIPQLYEPYRAVSEHHTEPQTQHVEALNTIPTLELAAKTPGQRCALLCITQDSVTSVGRLLDKQLPIKLMLGNEHTEYITTLFYSWILNAHSHNSKSLKQNKATFVAEIS